MPSQGSRKRGSWPDQGAALSGVSDEEAAEEVVTADFIAQGPRSNGPVVVASVDRLPVGGAESAAAQGPRACLPRPGA